MPNSRLEIAQLVTSSEIELAGGWVTAGNNLGAGGGDKLGSKDNFGFRFIVNNVTRGGFDTDGSFYQVENEAFQDRRYKSLMRSASTTNNTPQSFFSFMIGNLRAYAFTFDLIYLNEANTTWGRISRSVMFHRNGGVLTLSQETAHITEKVGNQNVSAYFDNLGNELRIMVQGLSGDNIKFSGMIKYHGLQNFIP